MNDVNNRIFKEFTEFFDNVEKSASEISVTMAYEITMKSTISTAIIVLESEGRLEERYWNHLRVQNNILDTQQINQLYSADDRNKTADLNPIRDLLDKRQELSDQIEQLEQEKASIEQQVKLEMQDAAYGTAPGYKVSWVSSESKRVDSQRLKKEQPDIFNRYSKNVSSRRFTIIHAA